MPSYPTVAGKWPPPTTKSLQISYLSITYRRPCVLQQGRLNALRARSTWALVIQPST